SPAIAAYVRRRGKPRFSRWSGRRLGWRKARNPTPLAQVHVGLRAFRANPTYESSSRASYRPFRIDHDLRAAGRGDRLRLRPITLRGSPLRANAPSAHPWMANSVPEIKEAMLNEIGAASIAEL